MEIRKHNHAGFEILTVVMMKNKVFLDFMQCWLVNGDYLPINMVYHSKTLQSSTKKNYTFYMYNYGYDSACTNVLSSCLSCYPVDKGSYIQYNNFGHNVSYFLVYSSYTSVTPSLPPHVIVIFMLHFSHSITSSTCNCYFYIICNLFPYNMEFPQWYAIIPNLNI